MKKFLVIFFTLITINVYAVEKKTTFSNEIFIKAQKSGKTIVINSWSKNCGTCAMQTKILNEAEKEFENILFLSFEQTRDRSVAKELKVDFWTTILVYKGDKLVSKTMGQVDKSSIYSEIKKGI
ncbi:thioredoxin family protein [Candidatus Pelagibacter sp.]|nr:thioredoxin family protein [Candidatus Pelagibacter sp.]